MDEPSKNSFIKLSISTKATEQNRSLFLRFEDNQYIKTNLWSYSFYAVVDNNDDCGKKGKKVRKLLNNSFHENVGKCSSGLWRGIWWGAWRHKPWKWSFIFSSAHIYCRNSNIIQQHQQQFAFRQVGVLMTNEKSSFSANATITFSFNSNLLNTFPVRWSSATRCLSNQ